MRLFVVCLAVLAGRGRSACADARRRPLPVPLPDDHLRPGKCRRRPSCRPPAPVPTPTSSCPASRSRAAYPVVDAKTYLYYIEMKNRASALPSARTAGCRTTTTTEQTIVADFKRLWATNFLDDLSIEVRDVRFSNGVIGKVVVYNMEERQRVKIVDYVGSDKVDQSKIEEELKDKGIQIRLDSFIDPGLIRRVAGVVRELYAAEGYQFAEVKPEVKEVEGGPKRCTSPSTSPKGRRSRSASSSSSATRRSATARSRRKMKENKGRGFFSFITRRRHLQGRQVRRGRREHHRLLPRPRLHRGAGRPAGSEDPRGLEGRQDALGPAAGADHRRRSLQGRRVQLRGQHGRQGRGAAAAVQVRARASTYSEKKIKKGLEKAQRGLRRRRLLRVRRLSRSEAAQHRRRRRRWRQRPAGAGRPPPRRPPRKEPAVVDVTMRVTEGKQYFVNRITFTGNTTTRDNVIRREIRLRRSRRVQHRSAEVQHQAAQSARLLQAARRRRHPGREDARTPTTRSTSR